MTQLVLQPCSLGAPMQHFEDTVLSPVSLDQHASLLGDDGPALHALAPTGFVAMWGLVPNNKITSYRRMCPGDRVVFTGQRRGFYTGTILMAFHNPALAATLWDHDGDGRTWEYMYAIGEDGPIDIDGIDLNRAIGYQENADIRGFTVLSEPRSAPAIALIDRSRSDSRVTPLVINRSPRRRAGTTTLRDLTNPEAVERAVAEFDALGRDAFLSKYGFGPARTFMLHYNDHEYDSKAIVGAAMAYQPGVMKPLPAASFSGGENGAVARLRALGFTVRGTQVSVPARLVSPGSIREAMKEWDSLGEPGFLRKYNTSPAARYHVVEDGSVYGAEHLVQAAYALEHPTDPPLDASDFRGDRRTIADPLRAQGFWVESTSEEPFDTEPPLGQDPQRYIAAAARVVGPLDRVTVGTARREQDLLRGALGLYRDGSSECGLCGQQLPNRLLVAAHIKKRSQCTAEERLDLPHVGMPACLLGCDALFEAGLITVSDTGQVLISPQVEKCEALQRHVDTMPTSHVPSWSTDRAKYFQWHRDQTFQHK
jgi:hypothetical protein